MSHTVLAGVACYTLIQVCFWFSRDISPEKGSYMEVKILGDKEHLLFSFLVFFFPSQICDR